MTAQLPELATALRDRPAQRVQWLPFSIPAGNVSAWRRRCQSPGCRQTEAREGRLTESEQQIVPQSYIDMVEGSRIP